MDEGFSVTVPCWYAEDGSTSNFPIGAGRGVLTGQSGDIAYFALYADEVTLRADLSNRPTFVPVKVNTYEELISLLESVKKWRQDFHVGVIQSGKWSACTMNKMLLALSVALETYRENNP